MNSLKIFLLTLVLSTTAFAQRELRIGDEALNIERDNVLVRVVDIDRSGRYAIRFLEGPHSGKVGSNWDRRDLATVTGCHDDFCVNDRAYNVSRDTAYVRVIGLQTRGRYVIEFLDGQHRGKRGHGWSESDLAKTSGCTFEDHCVGQRAYNIERDSALVRILGIQSNGRMAIEFLDGQHRGKRGMNWSNSALAKTTGCSGAFCVGDTALNRDRQYVRVQVMGIQINGRYVLKFLEGPLRGQLGANWREHQLTYDDRNRERRRRR